MATRLGDIVTSLSKFDRSDTIYAAEPWTEDSSALVAYEPESGGLPREAAEAGMKYFLEVDIASEVLEDWIASLQDEPSASATCERLIEYAINDA
ncbi:hypothetical protein JQ628_08140 [Bradyrhizobium lablabi]|uniref:hypothetical protein n=1 Tax=Bradyrhizobium lablabi TaxID=722472 RepID=UPI001BAAB074|nr:hypothetical protein [Bradyrhizobium lablabi]MBR1121476.1 hypothetical protein [Bradyrhizobium lablabi]